MTLTHLLVVVVVHSSRVEKVAAVAEHRVDGNSVRVYIVVVTYSALFDQPLRVHRTLLSRLR